METPPDLAAEPLVGSVTHVATTVLRPDAERTAVEGVSRARLDEPATGVKQATAGFAYGRGGIAAAVGDGRDAHGRRRAAGPATACVAATGDRAVQYGNTAGRLARQALFHLIQAQTPQLREATAAVTLRGF
ncbi:hypothetical protein ACFVRB_31495 [Streptomyces nojiriensis]|uniref:hypothetical protein n=1 Tax=Streptomyces nojiriensis TaxID=66374 RepID=UPI0036DEEBC2